MDTRQIVSLHREAEANFRNAKTALAVIIELTVLNIANLLLNNGTLFAFSSTAAYLSVGYGILYESKESYVLGIAVAALITLVYLACLVLSKKDWRYMLAAFLMHLCDTALVIYKFADADYSGVLDIALHIVLLVFLLLGTLSGYQLKKLPPLPQADDTVEDNVSQNAIEPLAFKRCKTLVKAQTERHSICYRRVKRCYELVVDGKIYCREPFSLDRHSVSCRVEGTLICAGYDGVSRFYILVNGQKLTQKTRLW